MPFVSKSQQKYAFATKQPWAEEFAKETHNFKSLPEKVKAKREVIKKALNKVKKKHK
jgi:hypothetical protein